jgi:propanol-preferring alcohol dehydrogenase
MPTMKAAVVEKFGEPLKIRELPIPDPKPGMVVVKVIASGVCHTDLHAAQGDWPVRTATVLESPGSAAPAAIANSA